jgi:hypothetical protein
MQMRQIAVKVAIPVAVAICGVGLGSSVAFASPAAPAAGKPAAPVTASQCQHAKGKVVKGANNVQHCQGGQLNGRTIHS